MSFSILKRFEVDDDEDVILVVYDGAVNLRISHKKDPVATLGSHYVTSTLYLCYPLILMVEVCVCV